MTGWLIAAAVLFLLAILPLGVNIQYDEKGFAARVIIGAIRFVVFPIPQWMRPKKKPVQNQESPKDAHETSEGQTFTRTQAPKKKPPKKQPVQAAQQSSGGSLQAFLPWIRLGLDFLNDFRRKLRLKFLRMKLVLAADDPCDLAVNYGRAWAALSNLTAAMDKAFVIQKRDLDVECDFVASETKITVNMDITITLGRLLALAAVFGVRALKEFIRMKNRKKGGVAA